ncbi:hypothetical protein OCA28_25145 [Bacillus cereus]|nr:hypothetical protein [Bacillus cereus]
MYSKMLKYLFEKTDNKNLTFFNKQDFPLLLETRFIGISIILEKEGYIRFSNELKKTLEEIKKINYIRNINLLNQSLFTDIYFEECKIKRTWLKGIVDLYVTPSLLSTRKLTDSDVIVDNVELARDTLLKINFQHGGLDKHGYWRTLDKEEIKKIEDNHYEIYPLTKIIDLPLLNPDIEEKLMNRYRIFRSKSGFYTDFSLDIHHSFTFGLRPMWMLEKGRHFPVINELDDIWYLINKTYYEVIMGDSTDLQLLFKTIMKIKQSGYDMKKIARRLANKEFNFLNEEAITCLFSLSNQNINENQISKYLDSLKKRIETKVS